MSLRQMEHDDEAAHRCLFNLSSQNPVWNLVDLMVAFRDQLFERERARGVQDSFGDVGHYKPKSILYKPIDALDIRAILGLIPRKELAAQRDDVQLVL